MVRKIGPDRSSANRRNLDPSALAGRHPGDVNTLVLWDIDGTLILSGGAGERALVTALHSLFGIRGSIEDIELAGRTDGWIARKVLAKFSVPDTAPNVSRYLEGYLNALPHELANSQARVLPGVPELVAALARRGDVAQGLLTGNLKRGAEIKLSHHRLWTHFAFGAFADDSETRNELGPHAVRRANHHHAVSFQADRIFVVGDTPHDITCGQIIGARTIGVATGRYTVEQLKQCRPAPTAVFADLSDTEKVLQVFG